MVGEVVTEGWWLKKLSPSGEDDTTHWNKQLALGYDAAARSVAVDSLDNVYVAGTPRRDSELPCLSKKLSQDGIEDLAWGKNVACSTGIAADRDDAVYLPHESPDPTTLELQSYEPSGTTLRTLLITELEPNAYIADFVVDTRARVYALTNSAVYAFRP